MKHMSHFQNSGFTLIEIIVSLMLVSILAAVAGFGIVEVAKGYQAARENGRMAQTAKIALLRISRELMELESVTGATNSGITVTTPNGTRAIEFYDTEKIIRLDEDAGAADGEILIDRVAAFQIGYVDSDDQPWTEAMSLDQLARIDIRLELSRNDGIAPIAFTTSINPRNNGTLDAPY